MPLRYPRKRLHLPLHMAPKCFKIATYLSFAFNTTLWFPKSMQSKWNGLLLMPIHRHTPKKSILLYKFDIGRRRTICKSSLNCEDWHLWRCIQSFIWWSYWTLHLACLRFKAIIHTRSDCPLWMVALNMKVIKIVALVDFKGMEDGGQGGSLLSWMENVFRARVILDTQSNIIKGERTARKERRRGLRGFFCKDWI